VQRVTPAGRKTSKSASEKLKYRRRFALCAMLPVKISLRSLFSGYNMAHTSYSGVTKNTAPALYHCLITALMCRILPSWHPPIVFLS